MNYIFSSAIVLSLLFIPFQLLLRKEKYFAKQPDIKQQELPVLLNP